jgi:hypothetical protein
MMGTSATLPGPRAGRLKEEIMTVIQLANESAMDVQVFSWTSPSTGVRARVFWSPGIAPMITWTNPDRFGWSDPSALPGRRQAAAVRALALAYATAVEEITGEEG